MEKVLLRHWSTFASYGIEAAFKDRFGDGNGTSRSLKAGFRHTRDDLRFSFETAAEIAGVRVNASDDAGDLYQLVAEATATNKFLWFAHITLTGGLQRQHYDERDFATGRKRRDWQFLGFAGFNFAPLAKSLIKDERLKSYIGSLTIGYKYARVDSTIEAQDKVTHSLAPVISLKAKFPR